MLGPHVGTSCWDEEGNSVTTVRGVYQGSTLADPAVWGMPSISQSVHGASSKRRVGCGDKDYGLERHAAGDAGSEDVISAGAPCRDGGVWRH